MSSSSRNTSSSTTTGRAPTPFCKVCRDAGRPESEYTNHFVKDQPGPNGKVVCPMLLNQACRICHNTGHTSSYCPQYRPRREERYIEREQPRREEPRREERYIEREQPRREEPRREERYIEREQPRREERYIEREQPRRDISFNRLRDDTERRDQEIRDRDDSYRRDQDRRAKPWLQAALKPASAPATRNAPYAHPHGPRVRLNLESTALCASKHAVAEEALPAVDMRKVQLNHASNWGDEPFRVFDPEQMANEFLENILILSNLATDAEHDFIAECDDQSQMPFNCGQ
jgi:hypothetical protein